MSLQHTTPDFQVPAHCAMGYSRIILGRRSIVLRILFPTHVCQERISPCLLHRAVKNRTFSRDQSAQIAFVGLLRERSSDSDGDNTKYVASVNDSCLSLATFSTVETQSVFALSWKLCRQCTF